MGYNFEVNFDVKAYGGAVGDGVTDDTIGIQKTINDAAAFLAAGGSPGPVYFPPSAGPYKVSNLRIPGSSSGWLTCLFDNGLYVTGSIYPTRNNAFIGRTSNSLGLAGAFVWGPNVAWQKQRGSTPGPVVDMQGTDQIYFQGINFSVNQANLDGTIPPAVHMHNDVGGHGCVWTTFESCVFVKDLLIDCVSPNNAGFGLRMRGCSVQGILGMTFFGIIAIRDSFVHRIICGPGGAGVADILLENILTESLSGQDFMEWNGGDRLMMSFISNADSSNSYLLKLINLGTGNWTPQIRAVFCTPGNGIVNPASVHTNPAISVEGEYLHLDYLANILYSGVDYGARQGLKVYGSRWLKTPFQVIVPSA